MTFRLSDDERDELRDSARRLLVDRSGSEQVRSLLASDVGYDTELWSAALAVERNDIQIQVRLITGADASGQTFMMMTLETSLSPKGQMKSLLESATWKP